MYPDELLQSTHSCRADHKLAHYRAEHWLEKYAEPMGALAWLTGAAYPGWELERPDAARKEGGAETAQNGEDAACGRKCRDCKGGNFAL